MVNECPVMDVVAQHPRKGPSPTKTAKSPKSPKSPIRNMTIDDSYDTERALKHIQKLLYRIPSPGTTPCPSPWQMTYRQLADHLISLRTAYISPRLRPILSKLLAHPRGCSVFNTPVDALALDLPTYHAIIPHPMDLGTIKSRLHEGRYASLSKGMEEIRRVFANAILFNGENHAIGLLAKEMAKEFEEEVKNMEDKFTKEVSTLPLCLWLLPLSLLLLDSR